MKRRRLMQDTTRMLGLVLAGLTAGPGRAIDAKVTTALTNVSVLPQPLDIPGLGRQRTLRIYLPPSYASATDRRYPVIYMHDGQNLFDAATAYAGEWAVDETLNAIAASTGFEAIVVGIDNGAEKRMNELSPVDHPRLGKGEGALYLAFIVGKVKPLVDERWRTLPGRASTAIMGSSMGGLISHAALNAYPGVFGRVGIFSPSYWVMPALFEKAAALALLADTRVYLYAGGREGDTDALAQRMQAALSRQLPAQNLRLHLVPANEHNEAAWRAEFGPAVRWLFGIA
jgi:predicted alpha/beta superfamily hydrolase